jgi:hypothetical protein
MQTTDDLTHVEHRVWVTLQKLAGSKRSYSGSYSMLAQVARCSQGSVIRAMAKLRLLGLVEIEREASGRRASTLLIVADDDT